MTIVMIGLRIGYGIATAISTDCLRHLPRLRPRPCANMRNRRLLLQSLLVHQDLIASSSSDNLRGSDIARTARPGIASKLFVGALMLIGTSSSSVPVIPEHAPLSAPTFSVAPLSSSTSSSQNERVEIPENIDELPDQDRLTLFHNRSGIAGSTWILFDSGASANCCPPWFAEDHPLLPVGGSCPILRSISGKTLDIIGKRFVELDCGGIRCAFIFVFVKASLSHWLV